MAKRKLKGIKVTTPKARASWVFLFRPRPAREEGKKPQYSLTLLFEKGEDLTGLKRACIAAGEEAWGPQKQWPKNLYTPFKDQGDALRTRDDGTEYLPDGYTSGAIFLEAKTFQQPGIVDQRRQPILDETQFYAGCYCRASIVFKAYDFLGKKGITCYLQHVQKWAEGEPLAGRTKAEDSFEAIALEGNDVDDLGTIGGEEKSEPDNLLGL